MTDSERDAIEGRRKARTVEEWRDLPTMTCQVEGCCQRFRVEHSAQIICRDCMSVIAADGASLPAVDGASLPADCVNFYFDEGAPQS